MTIDALIIIESGLHITSNFDVKYSDIYNSTICVDSNLVYGVESVWYIRRLIESLEYICR